MKSALYSIQSRNKMPQLIENSSQNCMAYALFDNVPDSPDELAFNKGDLLNVLEQNIANIEGWWLCSLKGRQGICPGNRLRLLPNVYDIPQRDISSIDTSPFQKTNGRRLQPDQVSLSRKFNDEIGYYDMPNRCSPLQHQSAGALQRAGGPDYDIPPSRHVTLGTSPGCVRCASASPSSVSPVIRDGEAYDVPRPHNHHLNQLTPSSSASSLTADSISSSNRSSMANMPDYDVPKSHFKGPQLVLHPSLLYDVPPSHNPKELPLELNSALENLERLECDTTSSIKKLLGLVGPGWRTRERLTETIYEIKLAVTRLQTSLNDLAEFGEGTLGNASKASDKNLAIKLAPLVSNLRKSYHTVNEATDKLASSNWSVDILAISQDQEDRYVSDALDTLISCSKALTEDIRQITSFIQGNSLLLFKKDSVNEWTNEYDYIQLNTRGINAENPKDLQKRFDLIENQDESSLDNRVNLDCNDRHILTFFGGQFVTFHKNLTLAIDAFLNTVERNQPPKIFLAHSKFVVLSAHKLVHIGDTVYRNVACKEIKERALNFSNVLSDVLAKSVMKTKQAALQFPTVTAVQEMVDSVLDISHAANNLKMCLLQATASFL